jgi:hypothetical protein
MSIVRNADAARIRDPLQARGDIYAVAENIAVVDDDVADMNPDPKFDTLGFGHANIAACHTALNLHGASDRIHRTGKFDEHPVASGLDDTAAVLRDLWVDKRLPARFKPGQRAFFICPHEAAISRYIRREDRGKTPFNSGGSHSFRFRRDNGEVR